MPELQEAPKGPKGRLCFLCAPSWRGCGMAHKVRANLNRNYELLPDKKNESDELTPSPAAGPWDSLQLRC